MTAIDGFKRDPRSGGLRPILEHRSILLGLVLGVIAFSFHLYLAYLFDHLKLFDQLNVFFNADPPTRLKALAHGWGMRALKHPHFSNFFSPLIRTLVVIGGWLGIVDGDGRAARESLALLVTPLFAGLGSSALFLTLRLLGLRPLAAVAAGLLGMLSMSQIVFASLPDSFGVSGGLLALLFLYAVVVLREPGADRLWIWGLLAFISAGVTITNGLSVGVVLWTVRWMQGNPVWRAFHKSLAVSAAALILVVLTSLGLKLAIEAPDDPGSWAYFDGTSKFALQDRASMGRAAWNFPRVLWLTFIAQDPARVDNKSAMQVDKATKIRFSYEVFSARPGDQLRSLGGVVIFIGAGFVCWRLGGLWRMIGLASAAIVLSNWFLHSFWGAEIFLYSQHWQVPTLLLLAGFLAIEGRGRVPIHALFATVVAAAAVTNYLVMSAMLTDIRSYF